MLNRLLLFFLFSWLIGCSTVIDVPKGYSSSSIRKVAVILDPATSGITRERESALQKAFIAQFRNAGYLVLEELAVNTICLTERCRPDQLFEAYPLDGVYTLKIGSVSQNNLLAGYYNAISGEIRLVDRSGATLLQGAHTERESGGLLLQSGQVLQGIRDQIDHSDDTALDSLSKRFAQSFVQKLPKLETLRPEANPLVIQSVNAKAVRPGVFEVCLDGTPHSLALFKVGRTRTNLRSKRDGSYCGIYLLDNLTQGTSLELRSPFGDLVKRPIEFVDHR
jgi:hypothetical protein